MGDVQEIKAGLLARTVRKCVLRLSRVDLGQHIEQSTIGVAGGVCQHENFLGSMKQCWHHAK
jgi:hypothetical protein